MAPTEATPAVVPALDVSALTCAACPHLRATHDKVDLRYCAATVASGAQRGCLCAANSPPVPSPVKRLRV